MSETGKEDRGCLKAALDYRARGWSVVPIRPGEKMPLVAWQEFQERRAGEAEIRAWYARTPEAGVAIVTGPVSGLVVLDIDPRHGGTESLFDWQQRHGPLPPTLEALTGGGGTHFYFSSRDPALRNRAGLAPGIDLRARGGLVVAPPSRHPSGQRYRWRDGHAPADLPPAPLPKALHDWLRAESGRRGHTLAYWRDLLRQGVGEGARNTTLASLSGHLLWHGVDAEVVLELLLAWNRERCRPPLSDAEVAQVVASITRLHEREEEGGD